MPDPLSADAQAGVHSARPAPMDREPGARLGQALSLLDTIDQTARHLRPLLDTVERMTGLSLGQVSTLLAFADGGRMPAGATPGEPALAAAAREGLIEHRGSVPGSGPEGAAWQLTEAGWVAFEQVQGLRIRALGTLVNNLDDSQIEVIRDTIRGIGNALRNLRPAGAATSRSDLPEW